MKVIALLLLCSLATLAHAEPEPDRDVRGIIPIFNEAPKSWGEDRRVSEVLGHRRGWVPFISCSGDNKPAGSAISWIIHRGHGAARMHGLLIDVVTAAIEDVKRAALIGARGSEGAAGAFLSGVSTALAELATKSPSSSSHGALPFNVWRVADNTPEYISASDPVIVADEPLKQRCSGSETPVLCAALGIVPRVTAVHVPPNTDKFAIVPQVPGTCVTGFVRVRVSPRYCRRGSDTYVVPHKRWSRVLERVAVREPTTAANAQRVCEGIHADFAGVNAANLEEVSRVAHRCLRPGGRILAQNWNGDDYQGLGVQLIASSDPTKNAHVGQPEITGSYPVLCKLRNTLTPRPRPTIPAIKVVPAPKAANGDFIGITRDEAVELCTKEANGGTLADVATVNWEYAVSETIRKLGGKSAAWVRSWNTDTYGEACIALSVDEKERDAARPASGGAINMHQCSRKLHGAVCAVGTATAASEEQAEEEADCDAERGEAEAAESAGDTVRRSEL